MCREKGNCEREKRDRRVGGFTTESAEEGEGSGFWGITLTPALSHNWIARRREPVTVQTSFERSTHTTVIPA